MSMTAIRALGRLGYVVQFAWDPDPTHEDPYHVQIVHIGGHHYLAAASSYARALDACLRYASRKMDVPEEILREL